MNERRSKTDDVVVIGGGPAGLMAAQVISQAGCAVQVYDAMPSVGRKFLMAGKGGLNLTHSEPFDKFMLRYREAQEWLQPMIAAFGPMHLRGWAQDLGIGTFVGTSGRVFPKDFKAAPLLRTWLHRLRAARVHFHVRHRWLGWDPSGALVFEHPTGRRHLHAPAVVLALGGASWPQLGSDAAWVQFLQQRGVSVSPLRPANCGFDVAWSAHFRERFAGTPIKSVAARVDDQDPWIPGECVVSDAGIEGGLIYAISAELRQRIESSRQASLQLDLAPGRDQHNLVEQLSRARGRDSLSNHLRRRAGIDGVKAGLLREVLTPEELLDPERVAATLKSLPLKLIAARPIEEAISSAGGVSCEALDSRLMLKTQPGVFCAGEMLDWEAPTGGYLLTACLASGHWVGRGVLEWLKYC